MTAPAAPPSQSKPDADVLTAKSHSADPKRLSTLEHGRKFPIGRALAGVAVIAVAVVTLVDLIRNPVFEWTTVAGYFFSKPVMDGISNTLKLTVLSMTIAIVISVIIANMRLSKNPILRAVSGFYVWFFRSIPLLVLLILWFNFSLIYPQIVLGVPFGPTFFSFSTSQLINAFWAAVLAFGLQQAAYTSEIIRAAMLAIPKGQKEAAAALGMTHGRTFFRIVLPQALRVAIPPVSNDTINLLKATSLVAFVSVPDLLYSVQQIYNRTYEVIPLLMVACLWYMFFVSVLSLVQMYIERALTRGRGQVRRESSRKILRIRRAAS